MIPEIEIWINRAESAWLDALYANAEFLYRESSLPSHDQTHHLRVWNLCKKVLREIAGFNSRTDQSLVEGVLIAAFFHDLGMVYSTREDHGKLGSDLCLSWFEKSSREKPVRFEEILRAIELHDRKNEKLYKAFEKGRQVEILGIISVADDLEALGIIGIYRYAEIYLRRGIPMKELGDKVLENVSIRYKNLCEGCGLCPVLLEKSRREYDELSHFFRQFISQAGTLSNLDMVNSGPVGVINYLRRHGPVPSESHPAERDIKEFLRKLNYELDQARQ